MRSQRGRRILLALGGLWLASVVMAVVLAQGALFLPPGFRPSADPAVADRIAGAEGKWQPATIRADDGARLSAWYFEGARRGVAVIVLHGVADSRKGMSGHARMLLRNGFSVLAPDSRGHGESGGEPFTYGLRERRDVARWVDWLARERHVSTVFGIGQSMGAAILLQTLPEEPRIRAAVADCPFSTFRRIAYLRLNQALGLPPWPGNLLAAPVAEQALLYTRLRFGIDLSLSSPLDAMQRTATPVLLIHGTEDTNIPPSHSKDLAGARNTQLWLVPGAHHVQSLAIAGAEYERRVIAHFTAAENGGN
jgi:alpha-beta hydrolase superfamily lysophospholipase